MGRGQAGKRSVMPDQGEVVALSVALRRWHQEPGERDGFLSGSEYVEWAALRTKWACQWL